MSTQSSTAGGIGFCGALTIAFIVLQLCSVINWSWWWVLGPLWIPLAVIVTIASVIFVCVSIFYFIVYLWEECRSKK